MWLEFLRSTAIERDRITVVGLILIAPLVAIALLVAPKVLIGSGVAEGLRRIVRSAMKRPNQ